MALKDVPPYAPGIPWAVWHEQQIERIFAEARANQKQIPVEANEQVSNQPVAVREPFPSASPADDVLLEISPYNE